MATTRTARRTTRKGRSSKTTTRRRKTHKFSVKNAEMLLDGSRADRLDPQYLFALLPMRVYHDIGDIGAGPGYFTIPLAKYAFHGKVYAIDMQQGMLDIVTERLEKARLHSVEIVLSRETKIPLDDESLDGALLVTTLHEATQPKTLLKEAHRLLRKSGWLGLVDWRKVETEEGPPVAERLERDEVVAMASESGFRVQSHHDINDWFYFLLLLK